jgi:RHS repeat-associated protein
MPVLRTPKTIPKATTNSKLKTGNGPLLSCRCALNSGTPPSPASSEPSAAVLAVQGKASPLRALDRSGPPQTHSVYAGRRGLGKEPSWQRYNRGRMLAAAKEEIPLLPSLAALPKTRIWASELPSTTFIGAFGQLSSTLSWGCPNWCDRTTADELVQRYYTAGLGRFMTPDLGASAKSGAPQSLNRYAYVTGDPINSNDPTGMDGCSISGVFTGLTGPSGGFCSDSSSPSGDPSDITANFPPDIGACLVGTNGSLLFANGSGCGGSPQSSQPTSTPKPPTYSIAYTITSSHVFLNTSTTRTPLCGGSDVVPSTFKWGTYYCLTFTLDVNGKPATSGKYKATESFTPINDSQPPQPSGGPLNLGMWDDTQARFLPAPFPLGYLAQWIWTWSVTNAAGTQVASASYCVTWKGALAPKETIAPAAACP